METRSIKRRRLMSILSRPRPDLPATFESLNDDTLTTILEFVGDKSYAIYAGINKQCKEVYLTTPGMTKETFVYDYGPLAVIINKIERALKDRDWEVSQRVGKGVVLYNRHDVMEWALEERKEFVLKGICDVAAKEGRIDTLVEVWNNFEDDDEYIFKVVDYFAAGGGKLDVLKWLETKGLPIDEIECAHEAARHGHLHILQWLQEEKGFQLNNGYLYGEAIDGDQLHVMKWLREKELDLDKYTFKYAALEGNLDILQWLHNEGCPWPEDYRVREDRVKPEALEWLRSNGYGNRLN